MIITCQQGSFIKIENANYGRTDDRICGNPTFNANLVSNTNCLSDQTLKLSNLCDNRFTCVIPCSNDFFSQPNLCPGTWKYLEVFYFCVDP